jgi:hypothetical protein
MSPLQKKREITQLNHNCRKMLVTKMTLLTIAISIMLILSTSEISLSSYPIHSAHAQSADTINQHTANINVDGNNYPINYNITNGKVSSIVAQKESTKLIVTIEPTKEGKLTVNLPRELIDYKIAGNKDGNFIVQINGKQVSNFKEIIPSSNNNQTSRILEINFGQGDRSIEIIGTQMAQVSVSTIKNQAQKEQATAISAAINKTKESLLANKTITKNLTNETTNGSQAKTNSPQAGGGGSVLNKTGEVAKTFVNKTTAVLSNITKGLLGGK